MKSIARIAAAVAIALFATGAGTYAYNKRNPCEELNLPLVPLTDSQNRKLAVLRKTIPEVEWTASDIRKGDDHISVKGSGAIQTRYEDLHLEIRKQAAERVARQRADLVDREAKKAADNVLTSRRQTVVEHRLGLTFSSFVCRNHGSNTGVGVDQDHDVWTVEFVPGTAEIVEGSLRKFK